jgi:ADP-heptose:LPS heptosyltransferase
MAVHPGVTAPSRQYAPERFAQAARQLALEDGLQIVFTGSPDEVELVESIRGEMSAPAGQINMHTGQVGVPAGQGIVPSISLAGQLNLAELGALLEQAPLLLSNNTGPVHLAAAVGTPVAVLYALTNPQHTPWGVPNRVLFHDVPCKYCYKSICPEGHHHCLELVTPQEVVQAVRALRAETYSL